jgi:subtilisin family serine protease
MSMVRITAPEGMDAEGAQRFLKQQLPNERFEYNRTYRLYRPDAGGDGEPAPAKDSSPLNGSQPCSGDRCYAAAAINWNPNLGSCAKNIRIGVIDTAVDPALFADRKIDYASASPAGQPKAASWHGTGVLALLSGVSRTDLAGLIPDAHFILADTFAADQNGLPVSDTASVLKALDLLKAFDVQVVNMSLSGPPDPAVKSAIERLSKEGVIFVAAAGNGGPTAPPAYPAAYKQVIAVTAVNKELNGYPYANRGDYIDIAAPGVRIWTAVGHRKNDYLSGTSFAAPYVTAVVAALAGRGATTKAEILNRLAFKDLGTQGPDPVFGRGLIVAPASCGLTSPPEAVTTTPHVPVTTRPWTVVQVNAAQ